MEKKIYLAYGSNMSLEQMYRRCPHAEPVGKGYLNGWRLMFKGSKTGSYATIEPEEGCTVPVVLWLIDKDDERWLDRYEGYPSFYKKVTVEFEYDNEGRPGRRNRGQGMVYVMPPAKSLHGLPTRGYFGVLDEGYRRYSFDQKILLEALAYTKCQMG